MRHVAVLAQPIGGLHLRSRMVEHPSRGYQPLGLRIFPFLRNQHLAVLVVWFLAVVAEEIDAGGKEVNCGSLEELVRATTSLLLPLLQGFQQCFCCLARRGKVVDVFQLDGVYPAAVLNIDKVDDVELHPLGHSAILGVLVLQIVVVELGGKGRELVVIHYHGKALRAVLADERLDNGKCLARTGSTYHPRATKGIDDIHPSLAELAFIVIAHRNVHAILVLLQLPALLKALILEVKTVFQ